MNKNINDISPVLKEVKESLQREYGNRLRGIVVHGSYARGEASEGSDIDLIILLDYINNFDKELDTIFKALDNIEYRYDILFSIIPIEEKEYVTRQLPVILNARKEGVMV